MSPVWLLVHMLAFTMWIGGGFAVMVTGIAAKRMDRALWGAIVDVQWAVYRAVIGPGAILVVVTGIIMTLSMYNGMSGNGVGPWLGAMQGAGIAGALVTLLWAMPTASRVARLEPIGADAALFDQLRKRLAMASSVGGTLALIALIAGAFYRRG